MSSHTQQVEAPLTGGVLWLAAMVLASANMAMNVTLFGRQSFDPVQDFAPVTLITSTPSLVVVQHGGSAVDDGSAQ